MNTDRVPPLYRLRRLRPAVTKIVTSVTLHHFGGDELPEQMLKLEAVAELMDLSKSQVERLCASGDLVSVKVRGNRRVRLGDYRAFAQQLEPVVATPQAPITAASHHLRLVGQNAS